MAFEDSIPATYVGVVGQDPTDFDREGNKLVTRSGKEFTTFRLAVRVNKDETNWYSVPIFNAGLRESVKRELSKGTKVAVEGLESSNTKGDRTYLSLMANNVYLVQQLEWSAPGQKVNKPAAEAEEF